MQISEHLFGVCIAQSASSAPYFVGGAEGSLSTDQLTAMQAELGTLVKDRHTWHHAKTQCVVAYFLLTARFGLEYDPSFCDVESPEDVWALVQVRHGPGLETIICLEISGTGLETLV